MTATSTRFRCDVPASLTCIGCAKSGTDHHHFWTQDQLDTNLTTSQEITMTADQTPATFDHFTPVDLAGARDRLTEEIVADPEAFADGLLAAQAARSMTPEGYTDEMLQRREAAGRIVVQLEGRSWSDVAVPVAGPGEGAAALIPGTVAWSYRNDRRFQFYPADAVDHAAYELGSWVLDHTVKADYDSAGRVTRKTRRFTHLLRYLSDRDGVQAEFPAMLRLAQDQDRVPAIVVYLVHLRPTAPQRRDGKVAMLVVQFPHADQFENERTGEVVRFAQLGYQAEQRSAAWRSAAIVCYLDESETDEWLDRIRDHNEAAYELVRIDREAEANRRTLEREQADEDVWQSRMSAANVAQALDDGAAF